MIFEENGLIPIESTNKKASSKRQSSREKKPVSIEDLGYIDKDQAKKSGYLTSEAYKKCDRLLTLLKKHRYAMHFQTAPVYIPGYAEAVKEPMDIDTVEKKLKDAIYASSYHFALDIRKIWNNSWIYNPRESEVYNFTNEISAYFELLMKDVGDIAFATTQSQEIQDLKKRMEKFNGVIKRIDSTGAFKGTSKNLLDQPMNPQEKLLLRKRIMMLPQDKLGDIVTIIKDSVDLSKNNEVVEFDIESLPPRKCRELEQYISKMSEVSKPIKKKPPLKAGKAVPKPAEVIR